ncbi:MAG: lysophospholipase [Treponema sp.]|jgi:alpha-beta hydrolase superfamily lysophospholipase|nr:lysophospholipase [Treponema sp.]
MDVSPQQSFQICSEPAEEWLTMDDGAKLFVRQWTGGGTPWAVVHIVHGMAEHSLRYKETARFLAQAGIEVWAADQRGHGRTADLTVNGPERGGLLGHCADSEGAFRVTQDIDAVNRIIRKKRPGIPLILLGHSWGSFITQNYIERYGKGLSGCILSGTRGPGGLDSKMGAPFLALLSRLRGCRSRSRMVWRMADGSYNKPFRPNRTSADWLSRNDAAVDAYIQDPLCGKLSTIGFYRDLTGLLNRIHRQEAMQGIPSSLPIYVISGSADPVGAMGRSPTRLVNIYRSLGIGDLEFVLYPDARHEPLNETNREEVRENILSWITKRFGKKNGIREPAVHDGLS